MSKNSLFDQFSAVSAKEWKQKIQFDLKGADYNESLVWESPEGIKVKPFYHGSHLPYYSVDRSIYFRAAQWNRFGEN